MPNTKKLLSITNLKKYFPIAKSSIFQKQQLYVRANEEITLDIYEGETLGIVGESGCGKSTLGRVLLQLYEQTAGTTMYYGASRADIAPKYVLDTLKHADKYIAKLHVAEKHAKELSDKVDALGDKATFFDIQNKNLAIAEYQTVLAHTGKILGGFLVEGTKEGAALLYKKALLEDSAAEIAEKMHDIELELDDTVDDDDNVKVLSDKKRKALEAKLENLSKSYEAKGKEIESVTSSIDEIKRPHQSRICQI